MSDCVFTLPGGLGPLHLPVAPFTLGTDEDPTLSGGPLSEWANGGVTAWWCGSRRKTPQHGRY